MNYMPFGSPDIELLESGKKLGVAPFWWWPCPPDWKSTNVIKTHLEPLMIDLLPISKLLSFTIIRGSLRRYETLLGLTGLEMANHQCSIEAKKSHHF